MLVKPADHPVCLGTQRQMRQKKDRGIKLPVNPKKPEKMPHTKGNPYAPNYAIDMKTSREM